MVDDTTGISPGYPTGLHKIYWGTVHPAKGEAMNSRFENRYADTEAAVRLRAERDNPGWEVVNIRQPHLTENVGQRMGSWQPGQTLYRLELQPRTCRWCDSPVDDDTFERFDETAVCSDECDTYLRLEARAEAMIDQIEWDRA